MFYNHLKHYNVQHSEFMKQSIGNFQQDRQVWKAKYGGQYEKALDRIAQRDTEELVRMRREKFMKERVPEKSFSDDFVSLPSIDFRFKKETKTIKVKRLQKEWEAFQGNKKKWFDKPDMSRKSENCATKKLLYEGVSREEEGRFQYLDARKRIIPERKFNWMVKDSFKYGWSTRHKMKQETSPHAKVQVIKHSIYRKNKAFDTKNHGLTKCQ